MTAFRRSVSRVLARWAVRIDPDPPTRRISVEMQGNYAVLAKAISDVASGNLGGSVGLGLRMPPDEPDGIFRY